MSVYTTSAYETPEITDEYLAEVQQRVDKATEGFWGTYRDLDGTYYVDSQPRTVIGEGRFVNGRVARLKEDGELDAGNAYNDATFMARARTDVPALVNGLREARKELADTQEMRDFYQRSGRHVMDKRDLAELVLSHWEKGSLQAEQALRMIRAALAVGDVKTFAQVLNEAADA